MVLGLAVAGAAMASGTLVVALVVAQGEARGHAFFHLIFGVAALALFTAIGIVWRPSANVSSSTGRTPLLGALWVFSMAALSESLGAAGYDRFNEGHRIEWLTTIHGVAGPLSGVGFLLVPIIAVVAAVSLATGWVRRRRSRAEGAASRFLP